MTSINIKKELYVVNNEKSMRSLMGDFQHRFPIEMINTGSKMCKFRLDATDIYIVFDENYSAIRGMRFDRLIDLSHELVEETNPEVSDIKIREKLNMITDIKKAFNISSNVEAERVYEGLKRGKSIAEAWESRPAFGATIKANAGGKMIQIHPNETIINKCGNPACFCSGTCKDGANLFSKALLEKLENSIGTGIVKPQRMSTNIEPPALSSDFVIDKVTEALVKARVELKEKSDVLNATYGNRQVPLNETQILHLVSETLKTVISSLNDKKEDK